MATVGRVEELVHFSKLEGVATITLDSPSNRNALSRALLEQLHAALDMTEQPGVRVVVLAHTPPVFCAGADLIERNDKERSDGSTIGASSSLMEPFCPSAEEPLSPQM